ncbi:MAG: hypothetical protein KBD64_00180 [Gammaproteobacteria bacterium]|nr:hypothetical protein [Gammaproteobacteria bacterium]
MRDSNQKDLYQVLNSFVTTEGQDLLKAVLYLLVSKDSQRQLIDLHEIVTVLKRSGKASDAQIKKLVETYEELVKQRQAGVGPSSTTHKFVPGTTSSIIAGTGLQPGIENDSDTPAPSV